MGDIPVLADEAADILDHVPDLPLLAVGEHGSGVAIAPRHRRIDHARRAMLMHAVEPHQRKTALPCLVFRPVEIADDAVLHRHIVAEGKLRGTSTSGKACAGSSKHQGKSGFQHGYGLHRVYCLVVKIVAGR